MTPLIKRIAAKALMRSDFGRKLVRAYSLKGYLEGNGWFASCEKGLPVDAEEECLPWYTYSFITFLAGRIRPDMDVFEFGSGHSTLWWSKRVSTVTSCEHDKAWYDNLKERLPPNVTYHYCAFQPNGDYCRKSSSLGSEYDCIVIDGRDRVNCAKYSIASLKNEGVIIWDNSERESYQKGYAFLAEHGFKRIDFWGLGPSRSYEWCTSLFYRDDNCLDL